METKEVWSSKDLEWIEANRDVWYSTPQKFRRTVIKEKNGN